MVTNVAEVRQARLIYHAVADRLRAPRRPAAAGAGRRWGIMVEVPAAALCAAGLARVADFFAIGSNDLTMYTLAADRAENRCHGAVHPAAPGCAAPGAGDRAGRGRGLPSPSPSAGRSRPRRATYPCLLGLGLRSLSVNATAVPRVKQAIRTAEIAACEAFAACVMAESEPEAVRERIAEFHARS